MLAPLVRAARQRRGWSQLDLARRAGLDLATVCNVEAGRIRRPAHRTLARLASALRVPVADLARAADGDAGGAPATPGARWPRRYGPRASGVAGPNSPWRSRRT